MENNEIKKNTNLITKWKKKLFFVNKSLKKHIVVYLNKIKNTNKIKYTKNMIQKQKYLIVDVHQTAA